MSDSKWCPAHAVSYVGEWPEACPICEEYKGKGATDPLRDSPAPQPAAEPTDRERLAIEDRNHAVRRQVALELRLAEVEALIVKWREQAAEVDTCHATLATGWRVCAGDLEILLKSTGSP